jgi:hypothetical protein
MSLRVARSEWIALGGAVEPRRRTGELRFWLRGRSLIVNGRRKDAPTKLVSILRQLQRGGTHAD